jgi:hypothetical protein
MLEWIIIGNNFIEKLTSELLLDKRLIHTIS